MKRLITRYLFCVLIASLSLAVSSCHKDEVFKSSYTDGPAPTSGFSYTNAANNALAVTFTNTGANVESAYWQFGDGSSSSSLAPVHTYAAPGRYTVTLKTASSAGYTATSTQTVVAIPAATANFAVASQFELGVTFANTSTSVASVSWDFGDGTAASTALAPQHRYASAGNYTVKLTVTGLLGDVVTKSQTISVQNTNLLKGGGFEAGTSSNWLVWSSQNAITPVFGYTGDSPAGGYDACLRFPSFSNAAGQNELIYQPVQVVAGKQYHLSALVKLPAGGTNDYLQFYISTDANTWVESTTAANANFFLALNNYHAWGATSSNTTAINGDLYTATLSNGMYGLGVATKGIYTAPVTGTVYIGIQAGVYGGKSNGDFLIDNVNFVQVN